MTLPAGIGAASEHYRADISSFFSFDLARWLPYNLVRTWHVQLSIFWTATSFLAAGIFLAPMIVGREPRRQHWLAYGLLGALALVVFGSMAGEYLDIHGLLPGALGAFGMQGWEYLELGRFWQVLLTVGLFLWVVILLRGLRSRLRAESRGNMPWLFFYTALAIPAFYAVGLPHGRGMVVPAAGRSPGVQVPDALPSPLGSHLRVPGQPADRVLLRDRHRADR